MKPIEWEQGEIYRAKVKPRGSKWAFYTLRLFRSCRALREYTKRRDGAAFNPGPKCRGMFTSWDKVRETKAGLRRRPEFGEILLVKTWLGSGVVAHEVTHLALDWARRNKWDLSDYKPKNKRANETEEDFCYTVGDTCRAIYTALRDAGFLNG